MAHKLTRTNTHTPRETNMAIKTTFTTTQNVFLRRGLHEYWPPSVYAGLNHSSAARPHINHILKAAMQYLHRPHKYDIICDPTVVLYRGQLLLLLLMHSQPFTLFLRDFRC